MSTTTAPVPTHSKRRLFRDPQVRRLRRLRSRIAWRQRRGFVVVRYDGMTDADCQAELLAQRDRFRRDLDAREALLAQGNADIQTADDVLTTIELEEDAFEWSGNPEFAWRTFGWYLEYDIPVPRWLRRYLGNVTEAWRHDKPDTLADIARTLGFGATPGPSDQAKARTVDRELAIVQALHRRFMRALEEEHRTGTRGGTNDVLFTDVATELEESYQTVFDTFYLHSNEPPALPWLPAYVRRRRLLRGRWGELVFRVTTRPPMPGARHQSDL